MSRIFCIGKNYTAHIEELAQLGQPSDEQCVIFMKPSSCIVPAGQPIVLPRDRGAVHHEAELVVQLGNFGANGRRNIPVDAATGHVTHLTLGLDLTLRDLQTQLKQRGAPWEQAKAFDGAAPLGEWQAFDPHKDLQALDFSLHVNDTLRQHGQTRLMRYTVAHQIHILSQTWRLTDGDMLYTGTPAGVGPLQPGDRLRLASDAIGRFEWRCE